MFRIVRADMYRLVRSKGFYITLALFFGMMFLLHYATSAAVSAEIIGSSAVGGRQMPFIMMEYAGIFLYFMLAFIVFIAAADFSAGTAKNVLSTGTSRITYYFAKLKLCGVICIALYILYIGIPAVVSTLLHGFTGNLDWPYIQGFLKAFLPQLLLCLAVTCVGVFFVFITKRTAAVTGLYIGFLLAPSVIITLLSLINDQLEFLHDYDITRCLEQLARADAMVMGDYVRAILIGVFYVLASIVCGILIFKKSDIK